MSIVIGIQTRMRKEYSRDQSPLTMSEIYGNNEKTRRSIVIANFRWPFRLIIKLVKIRKASIEKNGVPNIPMLLTTCAKIKSGHATRVNPKMNL